MKKIKMLVLAFALLFVISVKVNAEECAEGSIAKIGDTCYAEIQDAVNAVENDGKEVTIKIIRDLEDDEFIGGIGLFNAGKTIKVDDEIVYNATPATNKNIVFDFDGHTISMGQPLIGSTNTESQNLHFEKGNTVTLKNGTIIAYKGAGMLLQNYSNLTLIDFTLDGSKSKSTYVSSNNNGVVKMLGNTNLYAKEGGIAFDMCWAPKNGYPNGTQITIDTTGTISGIIELDVWGAFDETVKSTLTIKNINHEGTFSIDERLEDSLTITGGTFTEKVDTKYLADTYVITEKDKKYVVEPNTVIETKNEDVVFESEEAFSNEYRLVAEELDEEEVKEVKDKVADAYKENAKVKDVKLVALYDISVLDLADTVVPMEDGKFTITIAIDEDLAKYDEYKVVYIDDTGKIAETIDAKLVDGKIVFTTTHLSTYGIVGYNNADETNPNTGDNLIIYLIFGMLSLVVGAVAFNKLRKNA